MCVYRQMTSYLKLKRWLRSKGVDAAVLDGCFGLASLQEMLPGLGDQLSFSWWNITCSGLLCAARVELFRMSAFAAVTWRDETVVFCQVTLTPRGRRRCPHKANPHHRPKT